MRLYVRKRRVLLHLADDKPTIGGVWIGNDGGHYRIAAPELHESRDRVLPLDGELWVPADRVLYVQVVG